MKSIGVVRQLDSLGRIVIPIELRRTLGLSVKDSVEIFVDGDQIVLKKYNSGCIFCNSTRDVISYRGKPVCGKCLKKLAGGEFDEQEEE